MLLKDIWKDKIDGIDVNSAEDINSVANAVINLEKNTSPVIKNAVNGNDISIDDSLDLNIFGLNIYGKSVQESTPTPSNPITIQHAGQGGTVNFVFQNADNELDVQEYDLSTPNGLHGLPVSSGGNYTDASGQQWVCDEIDFARGVFVKRIVKIVIDYSTAVYMNGANVGQFYLRNTERAMNGMTCMCSHYVGSTDGGFNNKDGQASARGANFWISDHRHSTAAEFKNWLAEEKTKGTPVTAIYALETPIETPLSEEDIKKFKKMHTYHPNTNISVDDLAEARVIYGADTKIYIDKRISAFFQTNL